jgi:hypothetical protein
MNINGYYFRLVALVAVSSILLGACTSQLDPVPAVQSLSTPVPTAAAASALAPTATAAPLASAPAATMVPGGMPPAVEEPAVGSPSFAAPLFNQTLQEMGYTVSTYTDTVSGLAFDYPAGWILNDLSEEQKQNAMIYTVTLRSMQVTPTPKQQEGLPEGMTAIDISINKNGPKTLGQAVDERRAAAATPDNGTPAKITVDEDWPLRGGLPAHRLMMTVGPGQRVTEVITMIQGHMVLVSGQGDQALFNAIAASLRETP